MKDKFRRYYLGEMTPAEEEEFRCWMLAHEDDPNIDEGLGMLFDEAAQALEMHRLSRRRRRITAAVAAIVVGLVCLPSAFFLGRLHTEDIVATSQSAVCVPVANWTEKRVPAGRTDTLLLSDGSILYLNSGSRITFPDTFTGDTRDVFVDGEVYASVAKDEGRPFRIHSGDATVEVLGTTFDFKSYSDDRCVECLLFEGSIRLTVEVAGGRRDALMNPGNMAQFDRNSGEMSISDFSPEVSRTFLDGGAMHFYNLTMKDIAAGLERRFGTRIVILDEKLSNTRFFAIFNNGESLQKILEAISSDGRMRVRSRDGCYYLSSATPSRS